MCHIKYYSLAKVLRLKTMSFGYNFFHLANVLATTNSGPGLALNVGPDLDQKIV